MNQQAGQMMKIVEKVMIPMMSPSRERVSRASGIFVELGPDVKVPSTSMTMTMPMAMTSCQARKRRTAQRRVHQAFHGVFCTEVRGGGRGGAWGER